MAVNNAALEDMALRGAKTSSIATGMAGAGKGFVSGAMNVFMVGMAADLIMELLGGYNESKVFKEKSGFQDLLFLIPDLLTPGVETSFERISKMNDLTDSVQARFDRITAQQNFDMFNPSKGFAKGTLSTESTELYDILKSAQAGSYLPLLEAVMGKNKGTKAGDIQGTLSNYFRTPNIGNPYFDPEFFAGNEKNKNYEGSHKIDKIKNERIKGNSSHYITINIDEMNGMNNPTFTVASSYDMGKIEKQVGDALVKVLTGVVNDSQRIAN